MPIPNSAPDIDTENFWANVATLKHKVKNQIAKWKNLN